MKKISIIILSFFVVACVVAVATSSSGLQNIGSMSNNAKCDEDYGEGFGSTSIFGLWAESLDPYRSMDYYLGDDLVPGSIGAKKLPFQVRTQAHIYEIDKYESEVVEYGYAWVILKEVDDNGNTISEKPFRYDPSKFAKLRYNAKKQTVRLIN